MSGPSLIDLKAAALLREPPWKPWLERSPERKCYLATTCSSPKDDGYELYRRVWPWHERLGGEAAGNDLIEWAFRLASTVESYVLDRELADNDLRAGKLVIVNMLRPDKGVDVKANLQEKEVSEYVDELEGLLRLAKGAGLDEPLIYNILYAFYENLWYRKCESPPGAGTCAPPADTRFPTHTVFDRGRAAASMMNWVGEGGLCGYLVMMDLAGIQSFISNARKVRDLWAGSWIISALMWYVVSEVVRYLGPDVVLSPALELNPFYYSTLIKWLSRSKTGGTGTELKNKITNLLMTRGTSLIDPDQPLMPGTVVLALPCGVDEELLKTIGSEGLRNAVKEGTEEGWRKYFMSRYREGWKKIVDELWKKNNEDKEIIKYIEACPAVRNQDDASKVIESAKKLMNAVRERPPLPLRIAVVGVEPAHKELSQELNQLGRRGEGRGEVLADLLLLHWLLRKKLKEKIENGLRSVRLSYSAPAADAFEEYTSDLYGSGKAFMRCSVCGVEPAVMRFELKGKCGTTAITPTFTEGEQLGPYCLIKRLIGHAFERIGDVLGLYIPEPGLPVPSTTELANLEAEATFLCEVVEKIPIPIIPHEGGEGMPYQLRKLFIRTCPDKNDKNKVDKIKEAEELYGLSISVTVKGKGMLPLYDALTTGDEEVAKKYVEALAEKVISNIEQYKQNNKEVTIDPDTVRNVISDAFQEAKKKAKRYYAIIKGDGDFFGSRILAGILPMSRDEYVERVLSMAEVSGEANKFKSLIKDILTVAEEILHDEDHEAEITTILTPTYYRAVTRAMMATALKDYDLIRRRFGVLVYAGGDDVAALAPTYVGSGRTGVPGGDTAVIPASSIVHETRRSFWGSEEVPCFHFIRLGGSGSAILYPALCAYGRSYGVVITHHKDPFRQAWDLSGELEEMKDKTVTKTVGWGRAWRKDVTTIFYGRVGSVPLKLAKSSAAVLPNVVIDTEPGNPGAGVLAAEEIVKAVVRGDFSNSLLYDATRDDLISAINGLVKAEPERVADVVREVLERNKSSPVKGPVVDQVINDLGPLLGTVVDMGTEGRAAVAEVFRAARALHSGRR